MAKVFAPVVCDLSHHNTVLSFPAMYAAGIRGIIHKASQGSTIIDKTYASRRKDAVAAGLLWGAYAFADNSTVANQVSNFLRAAQPDENTLLALDWEDNGSRTMSLDQAKEFLRLVFERTGQKPVVYGGNRIKEALGGRPDSVLSRHRLWLCQYGPTAKCPPGWDSYWLHQYTGDAVGPPPHVIAGIKDIGVDLNVFGGTDLAAEWVCREGPVVVPIKKTEPDKPIVATSPADRPEVKTPAVVPPKNGFNIKDLMAYSRKAPLIVWGKRIGHTVWISLTTDKVFEYFGIAKDTRAQVETFFHDNAAVLAITGVITVILILRKLGIFVEDDVNSGRATPSGLTPETAK